MHHRWCRCRHARRRSTIRPCRADVTTLRGLRVTNLSAPRRHGAARGPSSRLVGLGRGTEHDPRVTCELSDLDIRHKGRPASTVARARGLGRWSCAITTGDTHPSGVHRCRDAARDLQYPVLDHWGRIIDVVTLPGGEGGDVHSSLKPTVPVPRPAGSTLSRSSSSKRLHARGCRHGQVTWADSVRPAYRISVIRTGLAATAAYLAQLATKGGWRVGRGGVQRGRHRER